MGERVNPFSGRLLIGAVLVLLGLAWTLDNLGYTQLDAVLGWWPAVLIAYGAAKLVGLGMSRNTVSGTFFLIAGGLLLAGRLGYVHVGWEAVWPLFLIFAGVNVLMRASHLSQWRSSSAEDSSEWIRAFALMGSEKRRSQSTALRGAELSAVMGGVLLDVREAKPADGRVLVDVFAMWGGIDVIVPETWAVEIESAAIMGAIEDERRMVAEGPPTATMVVRGLAMMGGVAIRNKPGLRDVQVGVHVRRGRRGGWDETHVGPEGATVIRQRGDREERIEVRPFDAGDPPSPPTEPR